MLKDKSDRLFPKLDISLPCGQKSRGDEGGRDGSRCRVGNKSKAG